jgi:hypothetical protein
MTPHRILQVNATATAASATGLLAARTVLFPLFGLASPLVIDIVAVSFLLYAAALVVTADARPVGRAALLAFAAADAAWVVASAVVLLLFWGQLAPFARLLIIAVALVVEVFATLQYRAAGVASRRRESVTA